MLIMSSITTVEQDGIYYGSLEKCARIVEFVHFIIYMYVFFLIDKSVKYISYQGFFCLLWEKESGHFGNFYRQKCPIWEFGIDKMVHFGKILCALILLNQFILLIIILK